MCVHLCEYVEAVRGVCRVRTGSVILNCLSPMKEGVDSQQSKGKKLLDYTTLVMALPELVIAKL